MTTHNPFGVYSPEQLDTEYIVRNFVEVFTDLPAVRDTCNTFIMGARGTGKSMLLRSLEPSVMTRLENFASPSDLPYLAVHLPLKKVEFAVPELSRLAGYAATAVGEHLLVMYSMYRAAGLLASLSNSITTKAACSFASRFDELMTLSSGKQLRTAHSKTSRPDSKAAFLSVQTMCEAEIMRVRQYFSRLSFVSKARDYNGALTAFLDFLVPLCQFVSKLEGAPDGPVFLMLDDADNLPVYMQKILNSWISTRSTHAVCLKVTTQLGYATLKTIDNRIIESPHDFYEVNLQSIYSKDRGRYASRVREIVDRRLKNKNIVHSPEEFFPLDREQAERLTKIESDLLTEWAARQHEAGHESGPSRGRDDVARFAVPRLMRELSGKSRSSHTYSYAGFNSLVDLSGGVIRWFLEPASRMYMRAIESGKEVNQIPVSVQDEIIKDWSSEFVARLSRYQGVASEQDGTTDAEIEEGASLHAVGHESVFYDQLKNLIDGLGRLFRAKILDSGASEQRVFSIIVRGRLSVDLRKVLGLAVRLGYLQTSDNAAKETLGSRLPRFVLARRLGPHYRLDVSGYAAHLSVQASDLEVAMRDPSLFVGLRLPSLGDGRQFSLPLDGGEADVL